MRERPILFSAPMVRALLAGTKTQTRRVVKEPISGWLNNANGSHKVLDGQVFNYSFDEPLGTCPYGQPGDHLWVRETWSSDFAGHYPHDRIWYAADDDRQHDIEVRNGVRGIYSPESQQFVPFRWRPSIHMPRSACRLVLEITGVRVERLQDISQADAMAEGVWTAGVAKESGILDRSPGGGVLNHIGAFRNLWEEINGAGAWQANPWVWVVEFRVLHPRTDGGGHE
jgi:hypothetical protein